MDRIAFRIYRKRFSEDTVVSVGSVLREAKRILIVPNQRPGGLLIGVIGCRAIRAHYPDTELTIVCDADRAYIAEAIPFIDKILFWDTSASVLGGEFRGLSEHLGERPFDIALCLSPTPSFRTVYLCYMSGAKLRVGFRMEGWSPFNLEIIPSPGVQHQSEYGLSMLRTLGIQGGGDLSWTVSKEIGERIQVRYLGRDPEARFVGFDISEGGTKALSTKQIQAIVEGARLERYTRVLLFFTFSARKEANRVKEIYGSKILLFEIEELSKIVALMEACEVFISGDTDLFHLATMMAIPKIVALSPEGDRAGWLPPGNKAVHVLSEEDLQRNAFARIAQMIWGDAR